MDSRYYYTVNGFIIHNLSEVPQNAIVQKNPKLCGGKGGFGSMLRAIGSQIEKTTNREMCRDLNGRRMRDVNNEKRLKEWLDKSDEREREKVELYLEKRRKRKYLLEQGPSSNIPFEEKTAEDQRVQIATELQEAICEAFENRKNQNYEDEKIVKPKKIGLNIDSDLESSSSSCPSSPNSKVVCFGLSNNDDNLQNSHTSDLIDLNCSDVKGTTLNIIPAKNNAILTKISDEPPCKILKSEINDGLTEKKIDGICDIKESKSNSINTTYADIDLEHVGSVIHLLTFGGDWIKHDLSRRGLKCGGTLMEKAQRLFSVKGFTEYPAHLLVGAVRSKRK